MRRAIRAALALVAALVVGFTAGHNVGYYSGKSTFGVTVGNCAIGTGKHHAFCGVHHPDRGAFPHKLSDIDLGA